MSVYYVIYLTFIHRTFFLNINHPTKSTEKQSPYCRFLKFPQLATLVPLNYSVTLIN